MYLNPMYFVFALPGLILALIAQAHLRSTFSRYARIPTSTGVNGQTAAQVLMRQENLNIGVRGTPGILTDFYNPADKTINLSQSSGQNSIASVAVVAHELGHAVQDAQGYAPMALRRALVPGVQVGAWFGPIVFFIGYLLSSPDLAWVGIIGMAMTVVFALVTLPVEYDASHRGLAMLQRSGVLVATEMPGARAVLNAAALTYVAAAAQALLQLLYYLSLLTGRRR